MTNDVHSIETCAELIKAGDTALGIEFGSTRIKAVLIGPDHATLASADHGWENSLVDGYWSYSQEEIWHGLQAAYTGMAQKVKSVYGVDLETVGSIGFSAMMHGYIAMDAAGNQLVPFRTWRNTTTADASKELTELFQFHIPQRWTAAHLYQAVLNGEDHVSQLASVTTLAGLVHERLSGQHVLGVGDASGIFPIDSATKDYDAKRIAQFDELLASKGVSWKVLDLLPKVLSAGEGAGELTPEGALLLDPTGTLKPGIPMCPPEGDAGTGMVATDSVAPRTGNVSTGTSVFAMIVLEEELKKLHVEIDPVTTPDGFPVAMVHSNNGTSELDAWVKIFSEFATLMGIDVPKGQMYDSLYETALTADRDAGGVLSYNLLAGEPILDTDEGRPMYVRGPESKLNLGNFMRSQLMSVFGSLRIGMEILLGEEGVKVDKLFAHGGIYKTPKVAQSILADALNATVSVGETAEEGGAWGMAVLAQFLRAGNGRTLPQYLTEEVFTGAAALVVPPEPAGVEGYNTFIDLYRRGIPVQQAAIDAVPVSPEA